MCSHWHVILHLHAKFRSNQTNDGEVLTSYRFFKMAAIESEIFYFRVQVWWLHSFMKVEIYLHTKFRLNISIYGWDKTTFVFRKRTATILEFYFRFLQWATCSHQHVILHPPAIFRSNRTNGGWVMTSFRFFKMAAIESEITYRVKSISVPNFGEISQSTAEIKLLLVSKNGRPPYWISIFCFNFFT